MYKSIWTPYVGEVLPVQAEEGNDEDRYAVAVLKRSIAVGYVPCNFSRTFYFFLRHRGSIECRITDHRKFGVGLKVLCTYTLSGKTETVDYEFFFFMVYARSHDTLLYNEQLNYYIENIPVYHLAYR